MDATPFTVLPDMEERCDTEPSGTTSEEMEGKVYAPLLGSVGIRAGIAVTPCGVTEKNMKKKNIKTKCVVPASRDVNKVATSSAPHPVTDLFLQRNRQWFPEQGPEGCSVEVRIGRIPSRLEQQRMVNNLEGRIPCGMDEKVEEASRGAMRRKDIVDAVAAVKKGREKKRAQANVSRQ